MRPWLETRKLGLLAALAALPLIPAVLAGDGREPLCRRAEFETHAFLVCEVDLHNRRLELAWKGGDGRVLGSLGALEAEVSSSGSELLFAMNAGMFKPDLSPVGLYIEGGREISPLDEGPGSGNFYLQPNGVLYWSNADKTAGVVPTRAFENERPRAEFATQSGPMLVLDGAIHPRFEPGSPSRKIRNGAGAGETGRVLLALSEDPVNFHEFARFFKDALGVSNALYLDGVVSSLYAPSAGRLDREQTLGPLILVRQ